MYRWIAIVVATGAMLTAGQAAHAAQCEGTISGVSLEPTSGDILVDHISLTNGETMYWPRFCSVINTANGIAPEGCRSLYASLLSAQAMSKTITLWIRDTTSCTSYTQWNFVTGFYFLRINN